MTNGPDHPLTGPNELSLFLEGDEELTALARESACTAEGLANQLSAVRRSQMSCWGVGDDKHVGENGSNSNGNSTINGDSESDAAAVAMVTDDDEEGRKGGNESGGEVAAARDHRSCMGWWEGVLGRWHERTQLVDPSLQKKFRVVNQGPWAQITASLADRERANRRAFMTESEVGDWLGAVCRILRDVCSHSESTSVSMHDCDVQRAGPPPGKGVESRGYVFLSPFSQTWQRVLNMCVACNGMRGGCFPV